MSYLTGTTSAPITVRQYPGERATIDGVNAAGATILRVSGAYTRYWGFEIMSSNTNRTSSATPVGWPTPAATGPEFNAYILLKTASGSSTTTSGAAPDPHFRISPNPAPVGTAVKFIDTMLNKPTTWSWNFGDSSSASNTSTLQNPTHTFVTTGTHAVRLTVTNSSGSATTTNTIPVY